MFSLFLFSRSGFRVDVERHKAGSRLDPVVLELIGRIHVRVVSLWQLADGVSGWLAVGGARHSARAPGLGARTACRECHNLALSSRLSHLTNVCDYVKQGYARRIISTRSRYVLLVGGKRRSISVWLPAELFLFSQVIFS